VLPEILELRRSAGDMIDDHVGHQIPALAQRAHLVPGPKPGIRLRVVDRIEARIGAVDRPVKGQKMRAAEQPLERSLEQILERTPISTSIPRRTKCH